MEAIKLAGLEPKAVIGYFEKLCSIPTVPETPR